MKNFYSKSLILIACLFISISASAYEFEVDGIYYYSAADLTCCSVTSGNNQYAGDVIIPSVVDYNNKTLSVTSISDGAFDRCSGLTSVAIPNSVTSIGINAFYGCSSLTSITIPNGVTSIGDGAFSRCSGLTSVTIPNSVTSIKDGAFSSCVSLMKFIVDSNNLNYSDIEGVLCSKDKTILISYPNAKGSKYNIPNSITSIGDGAFGDCSSLTSVTIPNSVASIGYYAFYGCSGLIKFIVDSNNLNYSDIDGVLYNKDKTILISYPNARGSEYDIPNSITSIGDYAFSGCSSLTSIIIPNGVTLIGGYAFYGCSSLISVTIPNSVTSIGEDAFSGCISLTSITIPDGVTSIGNGAFVGCNSLTSIAIPNSVTSVEGNTFSGCSSLTSVTISNSVTSIGYDAFAGCSSLTSIIILNSVTSIGSSAFYGCSVLASITIGNSVASIGGYAFSECNSITTINSLNPTPPTGGDFMADVYSNATLNIPNGSLSAYKAAAGWKEFKNIKEVDFSGVEQITNDDVKVIVKGNEIAISGVDESAKVEIYNMNGMLIYSGFEKIITAPTAGIYIVKVANKTLKVAIN